MKVIDRCKWNILYLPLLAILSLFPNGLKNNKTQMSIEMDILKRCHHIRNFLKNVKKLNVYVWK